jgi:hypothetical protein
MLEKEVRLSEEAMNAIFETSDVAQINAWGGAVSNDAIVTTPASTAPVVTSIEPNSGPPAGGTLVTINGQNFVAGCKAKFSAVEAQTTFNGPAQLTVTTPRGTVGRATVRSWRSLRAIVLGLLFAGTAFTAQAQQPPVVISLDPPEGPVGTTVRIGGVNFINPVVVRFNGVHRRWPPPKTTT